MTRHRSLPLAIAGILTATALALAGCSGTAPAGGSAASVDPDVPVVAFYGDSYTRGTGASSTDKRWSSIICADRGWTEVNPSTDGLGFVNNREYQSVDELDLVIDADPDIVIVTMGLNDNFSMPARADDIESAIDSDFARLSAEVPDARIVVVEPFWYTDDRPGSVQQIIDWVEAGAERIDADYIAGASSWIEGHPEWMASDGLHPNDDGYAAIAQEMDAALAQLGL
ncbi:MULTISPECIES: SGNH/GDSL hydrolase family protein [unclassified Leifsonia]|uniref:SGNH/GDSL hydrolase family protein n=1 Tax=unclassified Leifsonia TaxID=2663824 RepID=UPI0006F5C114|nr:MULTISPECIES: SGNH/GDSL hydrolase family protein [unclassified Leifsonia]KQX05647.1 G-D-S-L family lipolytic protein [Leifsonia sp. Root1293]KRA09282.1 G-D-S-L family lipolytic protein [Leifsonia sp. Root60]